MSNKIEKDILRVKKYSFFELARIVFRATPVRCVLNFILKFVDAVLPSIQIFITAKFIDTAINIFNGKQAYDEIYLPLILIILTVLYEYMYGSVIELINEKGFLKLHEKVSKAIITKKAKIDYKHMENNETLELMDRTSQYSGFYLMYSFELLLRTVDIPLRVASVLVVLITQVWWAGVAVLLASVPLFVTGFKNGRKVYEMQKEANVHKRKAQYIDDMLTDRESSLERYVFSFTKVISRKWLGFHEKGRNKHQISAKMSLKNVRKASIIAVISAGVIAAALVRPLEQNTVTIGMFIAIVQSVFSLQYTLSWTFWSMASTFSQSLEFLKDLEKLMALSETEGALEPADKEIYDHVFESIEFKDVSFKYPGTDKYVLKGLSFSIEAGHHYAFVGINGAGKTTIVKILTGLYKDFEGEIHINGKSINEYTLPQLKAMFSIVYQDLAKYYISLKENIMLGHGREIPDDETNKILDTAGLGDAVKELAAGIDTNLGKIRKDSSDLSEGQWQRLAIARTLASRAPVRILDEPTASLDALAESRIYEMFDRISAGKTTLLITHRLGATKIADEVILIEDGRVSERGSHEKLMADDRQYAVMYNSQRGWYM